MAITTEEAHARCTRLAESHYENFPVGRLVPPPLRPHIHAVYAFARTADDLADEGYQDPRKPDASWTGPSQEQRLDALDHFRAQLDAMLQNRPVDPQYEWIFTALAATMQEHTLPPSLFYDLLSAFRQDIFKRRYADFDEVLDYCRRSANPIGRLVLHLHGHHDSKRHKLSDHVCTGLQLANFWQDVAVDLGKDRIYLPEADQKKYGFDETLLFAGQATPAFRECMKYQVERTRRIFHDGEALSGMLIRPLRWEIRLTWLGGTTILKKIERQGYDTLSRRPKITKWDMLRLLPQAWLGF